MKFVIHLAKNKNLNMKKVFLSLIVAFVVMSCGDDKGKKPQESVVEEVKDTYSITMDALYEKDDELIFVYKFNGFWDYEHPIKHKVTGQPGMQRIVIKVPANIAMENVQVDLSSNKEQQFLPLTNVTISKNDKQLYNGANMAFVPYFNMGVGVSWDAEKTRYILHFDKEYPPRMVGNEKLEELLKQ